MASDGGIVIIIIGCTIKNMRSFARTLNERANTESRYEVHKYHNSAASVVALNQ